MYGDIAAWMMQFLAGFTPEETDPGFRAPTLRPRPAEGVNFVQAAYRGIAVEWKRSGSEFRVTVELPADGKGRLILPNGSCGELKGGRNEFTCMLP